MERLTNDLGLIRGSFNFEAVKEAVERLYYLEEWLEKENKIEKINNIKDLEKFTLCKKEKCCQSSETTKKEIFRPYLTYVDDRIDFINLAAELFGGKKSSKKQGYIGTATKHKDSKNISLFVGDVIFIEDLEKSFDSCVRIIGEEDGVPFAFGFKSVNVFDKNRFKVTRVKSCKDLTHKEKFGPVIAILKEEE